MRMPKLTLSNKILVAGTFLGVLTVSQGFLALSTMYGTKQSLHAMSKDTYATLFLAGQMKAVAKDQRIAIILELNAAGAEEMAKNDALVDKAEADLKKIREEYPKFDPRDREMIGQLTERQADFYRIWLTMKELSHAGNKAEAWKIYNTQLTDATKARRKIEEELAEIDSARGNALEDAAVQNISRGIPEVWAVVLFTVVFGSTGAFMFAHLIRRSIEPLEAAIVALGKGVLRGQVDILSGDDIGSMSAYMNGALEQLTCTVSGIDYCSDQIATATNEILTRAKRTAESAFTQRDRIVQINNSMQEMVGNVQNVSEDSCRASESASNAVEIAKHGGLIVNEALVTMRTIAESVHATAQKIGELGKSSDQIGRVVAVIDEIAGQTNLLALNAAIEAARAGDQGRGFAVVAGEVRRLAERTTNATKEIGGMIETVQRETRQAVERMETGTTQVEAGVVTTSRAGASLEEIIAAAQNVGDMISRISHSASQQDGAAQEIKANVEQISRLTSESVEDAQRSANTCDSLSKLAESLKEIVHQFTFRQIISSGAS